MAFSFFNSVLARRILVSFLCSLISFSTSEAEFLKTGTGVYQSTGKRAKIIISQEQPGVFIMFGPEIEVQAFNPAEVKKDPLIAHAFIRFDPQLNRYTSLIVGEKDYRVVGSFSLLLQDLRITVDNNNPYLSVVLDSPKKGVTDPEILGLLGLSVIVNTTGQQAVALLEANQFTQYEGVISPYIIKDRGLQVNGQDVHTTSVGLALEQKNVCLQPGAVVLQKAALDRLSSLKGKEEIRDFLSDAIMAGKKKSPLSSLLKLRVSPDSIIALDPIKGNVRVVKKVSLSSESRVVCSMDEIRIQ